MLKLNFKVVYVVLSEKHVESFIKCEYKPKKVQSQLTKVIINDLDILSSDKCVPYSIGFMYVK